ncbi:POK18 protein, partial [Pheucticus melanocephalus]|nr:POK18 protein [Pheucticus melanocephalus]
AGLEISATKIQAVPPWKYLGWRMTETTIMPQKIQIRTSVKNLQELQQLLGEINWVRPVLGITNDELSPLFDLLRGSCDITSPRTLTPEAHAALDKITEALQRRQAHRFLEMIAQIVMKARSRLLTLAGQEFSVIYLPLKKDYLNWAMQNSDDLQYAFLGFPGLCSIHYPAHKLLQAKLNFREKPKLSEEPLNAVTLFTDGSGKTHKSVATWLNQKTNAWESDVQTVEGSPQIVELAAVVRAFQLFPQPLNLITDSAYV